MMTATITALAQTPNTSWYTANPAATTFTISTADQLAGLAVIANAETGEFKDEQFEDETITLANDSKKIVVKFWFSRNIRIFVPKN